jgi:hypothetical protein
MWAAKKYTLFSPAHLQSPKIEGKPRRKLNYYQQFFPIGLPKLLGPSEIVEFTTHTTSSATHMAPPPAVPSSHSTDAPPSPPPPCSRATAGLVAPLQCAAASSYRLLWPHATAGLVTPLRHAAAGAWLRCPLETAIRLQPLAPPATRHRRPCSGRRSLATTEKIRCPCVKC